MTSSTERSIILRLGLKEIKKKKTFGNRYMGLEVWRVQRHDHEQTRNQTSTRQSDDPTREDETDLLPVDGLEVEVAERDTDGGARQALCGGDGKGQTRGQEDSDGGTELHGETTGRRDLCDLVSERANHVVAVKPETSTKEQTGDD